MYCIIIVYLYSRLHKKICVVWQLYFVHRLSDHVVTVEQSQMFGLIQYFVNLQFFVHLFVYSYNVIVIYSVVSLILMTDFLNYCDHN